MMIEEWRIKGLKAEAFIKLGGREYDTLLDLIDNAYKTGAVELIEPWDDLAFYTDRGME